MKKQTMAFTGFVALVVGYAIYDYKSEQKTEEKKQTASMLATLSADQISKITLKNEKGEFSLSKSSQGWSILSPIEDAANDSAVQELIDGIVTEKSNDVAAEGEAWTKETYGLVSPKGFVSIEDNSGKKEQFVVSSIKSFQGDAFIQKIDEKSEGKKVFVANSTWFAKVDKSMDQFRDRRWMRTSAQGAKEIEFTRIENKRSEKFKLIKKDDKWVAEGHLDYHLDQNKVREILGMLNSTEGLEIVADKSRQASSKELKAWGLAEPRLHVQVHLQGSDGNKKTWLGKFSSAQDKEKVSRLLVSDPYFVFKIAPTDSDKFWGANLDSFRDRTEPFSVDKTKIKKIEVSFGGKVNELSLEGEVWKSANGKVDSDRVRSLITKFSSLKLAQFEAKDAVFDKYISFKNEQGQEFYRLQWGKLEKAKINGAETSVFIAKSSMFPKAFTVLEGDINSFKLDELMENPKLDSASGKKEENQK